MLKKHVLLYFGVILFSVCHAQYGPIEIEYEYHDDRSISFYAINNEYKNYTVTLDFTTIMNLHTSRTCPYSRTVLHGRTFLLKLIPNNPESPTNYTYSYSYREGCLKTMPDTSLIYLLPYKPGEIAKNIGVIKVTSDGKETIPKCSFTLNTGDTIYAARGGVVTEVIDSIGVIREFRLYSNTKQRIQIFHEDCTFGDYSSFSEIFVREGGNVHPGEAIGIAGNDNINSDNATLLFFVAYYKEAGVIMDTKRKIETVLINPKFHTSNGTLTLKHDMEYTSEHPESVITQEMNKRQIKRWKKNNNIN